MHMGAMYQLGKVASPMTGKIERDLKQAQYTIDLIAMLVARTKGNLSEDEETFMTRTLSELQMNFLDEAAKPDTPESPVSPEAPEAPDTGDSAKSNGSENPESPAGGDKQADA
jgi:Domain of unknown function (DUF1844)